MLFPWDYYRSSEINLGNANLGMSLTYPFGTDHLGRDTLVRLSQSVQENIPILWLVVSVAVFLGWLLGSIGIIFSERFLANGRKFPLDLILAAIAGAPLFLLVFVFSIGFDVMGLVPISVSLFLIFLLSSYLQVRNLYGESKELAYWRSQLSIGGEAGPRIIQYGILGAWSQPMLSFWMHALSLSVIAEVSLSYLGFGIQEPSASLGNILAAHFSDYLHGDFRVLLVTVVAMLITIGTPSCFKSLFKIFRTRVDKQELKYSSLN